MLAHPLHSLTGWLDGLTEPFHDFVILEVYGFGQVFWPQIEDHRDLLSALKAIKGEWEIVGMTLAVRELVSFALFNKTGPGAERMAALWKEKYGSALPPAAWNPTVAAWKEFSSTTISNEALNRWHAEAGARF
jgi:hypothetical protein